MRTFFILFLLLTGSHLYADLPFTFNLNPFQQEHCITNATVDYRDLMPSERSVHGNKTCFINPDIVCFKNHFEYEMEKIKGNIPPQLRSITTPSASSLSLEPMTSPVRAEDRNTTKLKQFNINFMGGMNRDLFKLETDTGTTPVSSSIADICLNKVTKTFRIFLACNDSMTERTASNQRPYCREKLDACRKRCSEQPATSRRFLLSGGEINVRRDLCRDVTCEGEYTECLSCHVDGSYGPNDSSPVRIVKSPLPDITGSTLVLNPRRNEGFTPAVENLIKAPIPSGNKKLR